MLTLFIMSVSELSRLGIDRQSVNEEFDDWIHSPRADLSNMNAVMEDIRLLLPLFEYNDFALADRDVEYEGSQDSGHFVFKEAIDLLDLSSKAGLCGRLAARAYILILEKYPELRRGLYLLSGEHKKHFYGGGDNRHLFLGLAMDEPSALLENIRSILPPDVDLPASVNYVAPGENDGDDDRRHYVPGDLWIIDPSLNEIVALQPFHNHDYSINVVAVQTRMRADVELFYQKLYVLALPSDLGVVSLAWTISNEQLNVRAIIKKVGGSFKSHRVGSDDFNTVCGAHPELVEVLKTIKDKMQVAFDDAPRRDWEV